MEQNLGSKPEPQMVFDCFFIAFDTANSPCKFLLAAAVGGAIVLITIAVIAVAGDGDMLLGLLGDVASENRGCDVVARVIPTCASRTVGMVSGLSESLVLGGIKDR